MTVPQPGREWTWSSRAASVPTPSLFDPPTVKATGDPNVMPDPVVSVTNVVPSK